MRFIRTLFVVVLVTSAGFGNQEEIRLRPLPEAIQRPLNLESVEDLFLATGVTANFLENYKAPTNYTVNNSRYLDMAASAFTVYPNIDLVDFEVDAIRKFFNAEGPFAAGGKPKSHRGIILLRYGLEHPAALELFKELKKDKVHSAVIVTDGPTTADEKLATFPMITNQKGETKEANYTNDIRPAYLKKSGQGALVRELLKYKYKLRSPTFNPLKSLPIRRGSFYVTMSALSRNVEIDPIMHQKEALLYVLKDPKKTVRADNIEALYVIHGTGNWTRPHFNRTFIMRDINNFALDHAYKVIANFAGKDRTARINNIDSTGRLRAQAKDGSWIETAYTDGDHELNTRMIMFLLDVAKNPKNYAIDEVLLSHFVFTNKNMLRALYAAWSALKAESRPFKIYGVLDEKFAGVRGFGVAAALEAFDVKTQYGIRTPGLPQEFADSVNLVIDFREVDGATGINPDGPPKHRHLWHDKTTLIKYRSLVGEPQPARMRIYTGSYNNSNNYNNLERQDEIDVLASSPLAQSIRDSISLSAKRALAKKHALFYEQAIVASSLATFIGHSVMDLDWSKLLAFRSIAARDEYTDSDLVKIRELLFSLADKPSRLGPAFQVSREDLELRSNSLIKFFEWYRALESYKKGYFVHLRPKEILEIAFGIMETPRSAKFAIQGTLWGPDIPRNILEARAYSAYQFMNLKSVYENKKMTDIEFPFSSDLILRPDYITNDRAKEIANMLLQGDSQAVAREVFSAASQTASSEQQSLLASADVIESRLNVYKGVITWIFNQSKEAKGAKLLTQITMRDVLASLILENSELIIRTDVSRESLINSIRYLLILRGYSGAVLEEAIAAAMKLIDASGADAQLPAA